VELVVCFESFYVKVKVLRNAFGTERALLQCWIKHFLHCPLIPKVQVTLLLTTLP
jgi:hypothetical protein